MKVQPQVTYVYTLQAVKSSFRRGVTNVLLFLPNDGRCVRVNKDNYKRMAKRFRKASKHGKR